MQSNCGSRAQYPCCCIRVYIPGPRGLTGATVQQGPAGPSYTNPANSIYYKKKILLSKSSSCLTIPGWYILLF